jgi:hypothetical protein
MKKVIFETEEAVFQFDRKDVKRHLKFLETEHGIEAVTKLLEFISTSKNSIVIPKEHSYFGYVTLDLISNGEGSVICKTCNQTYQSKALKSFTVGHGKSPFDVVKFKMKGGICDLFRRKQILPGTGGVGYECPESHGLIARVTWRT